VEFPKSIYMTQETPAKVLSLLGVALVSLSFMFAVTVSNASFTQVYNPIPDNLGPAKVMAVLDNVSNSYSNFVYAQLVRPEAPGYAMAADNLAFVGQGASEQISNYLGLGAQSSYVTRPQVAGASTEVIISKYYPVASGGGLGLFSLLMGSSN
jgi:hypothetical protein